MSCPVKCSVFLMGLATSLVASALPSFVQLSEAERYEEIIAEPKYTTAPYALEHNGSVYLFYTHRGHANHAVSKVFYKQAMPIAEKPVLQWDDAEHNTVPDVNVTGDVSAVSYNGYLYLFGYNKADNDMAFYKVLKPTGEWAETRHIPLENGGYVQTKAMIAPALYADSDQQKSDIVLVSGDESLIALRCAVGDNPIDIVCKNSQVGQAWDEAGSKHGEYYFLGQKYAPRYARYVSPPNADDLASVVWRSYFEEGNIMRLSGCSFAARLPFDPAPACDKPITSSYQMSPNIHNFAFYPMQPTKSKESTYLLVHGEQERLTLDYVSLRAEQQDDKPVTLVDYDKYRVQPGSKTGHELSDLQDIATVVFNGYLYTFFVASFKDGDSASHAAKKVSLGYTVDYAVVNQ